MKKLDNELYTAAKDGNLKGVINALKNGAEIEATTKAKHTPLIIASKQGHLDIVQLLIEQGANINAQNDLLYTPLMMAAEQGHLEIFELLLSKGADFMHRNIYKSSVLYCACNRKRTQIAKIIIEKIGKTPVSDDAHEFNECIFTAIRTGNAKILQLLIDYGANPNIDGLMGPPIVEAADRNKLRIVKLLLENGADINGKNRFNSTALTRATFRGYTDVVKFLVANGAKAEGNEEAKSEARCMRMGLYSAYVNADIDRVKRLLAQNADPKAKDDSGRAVIDESHHSMYMWDKFGSKKYTEEQLEQRRIARKAILKLFKELPIEKADTSDVNKQLLKYAQTGNLDGVKKALQKGAKVLTKNEEGKTALDLACKEGHYEVGRILEIEEIKKSNIPHKNKLILIASLEDDKKGIKDAIKNKANLNTKNQYGNTPLMLASEYGNQNAVKALIEAGVNINETSKDSYTPLMWACYKGHYDIVKLFIDNGVNMNYKDKSRKECALIIAAAKGHKENVRLLLMSGAKVTGDTYWDSERLASDNGHLEIARLVKEAYNGRRPEKKVKKYASHKTCVVCKQLPESVHADRMKMEGLPEATSRLEILDEGYYRPYRNKSASGEYHFLLKCPHCGTYYKYYLDSEGGVGQCEDEYLTRITKEEALKLLKKPPRKKKKRK